MEILHIEMSVKLVNLLQFKIHDMSGHAYFSNCAVDFESISNSYLDV